MDGIEDDGVGGGGKGGVRAPTGDITMSAIETMFKQYLQPLQQIKMGIYKTRKFIEQDGDTVTTQRTQATGIAQGCP
eukprot:2903111-Pyramimonas_sp.AAC.1